MLSVPNCFLKPREAKSKFGKSFGDHFTLLEAYDEYKKNSEDKDWCEKHFFNDSAMVSVDSVRQQLVSIMSRFNLECSAGSHSLYNYTNIKKAILSGYFLQVANRQYTDHYLTVKDKEDCFLHPSSCLGNTPEWVVYHEYVLTTRRFMRTVTEIRREWLAEVAPQCEFTSSLGSFSQASRRMIKAMTRDATESFAGGERSAPYILQGSTQPRNQEHALL